MYATTAYEADGGGGVVRPALPTRCVWAGAGERCSLYVDHYRDRKTGPRYPVAVVGCTVHAQGRYTLYPPGHYPYGREALAPSGSSGELLLEAGRDRVVWEATLFAAAVDAAGGARWPSSSPWDDARRRRTQGRRLELAGRLLGVHPELERAARERIATHLGVAMLTLLDAARRWGRSWTLRGRAIVAVLGDLPLEATLLDRLVAAGAVSGVWADPRRWDAARGRWTRSRSGDAEPPGVGEPRSRGPPPTTSPGAGRAREPPSWGR